jgi:predicted nucleic acid-binding protein
MTDGLVGTRKLYIDANICLYLVQGLEPFQSLAKRAFSIVAANRIEVVSSELTLAECLYGLFKSRDTRLETSYREMFSASGAIKLVPVDLAILGRAAKLGGTIGLKLIDSIHMATAIQTGCDAYLTND